MDTLKKTLASRTFWTVALMVVVSGVQAFVKFIPTDLYVAINTFLGSLAVIFHVNPSQDYQVTPEGSQN